MSKRICPLNGEECVLDTGNNECAFANNKAKECLIAKAAKDVIDATRLLRKKES